MLSRETFYTYLWLREDGTPYYVGKGTGRRAIREGSPKDLTRILIQEHPSEADAFAAEKFLIALYGRKDLGTGCLRNLTDGGDGASGRPASDNLRQKMKGNKYGLGYKFSEEQSRTLSEIRRGRQKSERHCRALSEALHGKPKSDEHRRKLNGVQNGQAKLSEDKVREIRALYAVGDVSQALLARTFGLAINAVNCVIHRKTWAHVQ